MTIVVRRWLVGKCVGVLSVAGNVNRVMMVIKESAGGVGLPYSTEETIVDFVMIDAGGNGISMQTGIIRR